MYNQSSGAYRSQKYRLLLLTFLISFIIKNTIFSISFTNYEHRTLFIIILPYVICLYIKKSNFYANKADKA